MKFFIKNFRYLSAPEIDDEDSDSTNGGSSKIDSQINKFSLNKNNKNQENTKKFKLFNFEDKEISRPFPNPSRKKSRIVLDDLKLNTKDYAMEFESLYDNYERDVDFVDKIDSQNSLNSEKDFGGSLKKRSSIIPFGKKSSKKDCMNTDKFSHEIDEFFAEDNNSLNFKRKSSILSILESNLHNKKNFIGVDEN